jgi:hypothetical protein
MIPTPAQLKAARQLLDWSRDDVAGVCGLDARRSSREMISLNADHGASVLSIQRQPVKPASRAALSNLSDCVRFLNIKSPVAGEVIRNGVVRSSAN